MTRSFSRLCAPFLAFAAAFALVSAAAQPAPSAARTLDAFETLDAWTTTATDGVSATVAAAPGVEGRAARFAFDFHGGAGYATLRRALPLTLPENYEISFSIRGDAPVNNLEFKLADQSGDNVWWSVQRGFSAPHDWRRISIRRRQIEFAWGPTADRVLRRAAFVEFTLSAGTGGAGAIDIDNLVIRELPPQPASYPAPLASATSRQAGFADALAVDGEPETAWRSAADGGEQTITFDLGALREFGGLVLRWRPGEQARRYDVLFSENAAEWRLARRIEQGDGGVDAMMLTESETRYVRLRLFDGPGASYGLAEAEIRDLAFGATPQAFLQALAREHPRGAYPRAISGEQNYWTLVGVDGGGARSALFSEDGDIELGRGGVTVEPFVIADGQVRSWANVEVSQSLPEGALPMPAVRWATPGWELRTTAFAAGEAKAPLLLHRYELVNFSQRASDITLAVALRPFQVNPPQQFLNTPGGFSPIRDIAWNGSEVLIDGVARMRPLTTPSAVRTASFDDGAWIGANTEASRAQSEQGFAAQALIYRVHLAPGQHASFAFVSMLSPASADAAPARPSQAWFDAQERTQTRIWRERLGHVRFVVPPQGARLVATLRSSIATMLMSRDGPALQPGTRSYARSWIRDGAMMSEGLLRAGLPDTARDYLAWYAPYQFASGKVPCCVDTRGADPVPENDSHGQLIHLAALVHRYTGDRAALERAWPHVEMAARYIDESRQSERTPANQAPGRRALYGLMPPSISHEGYSARPAYSYWDDFWTARGLDDAVYLAQVRRDAAAATRFAQVRDEFEADLFASIRASAAQFKVQYIPGAADLGDFDATSTTIALAPGGLQARLPQDLLNATFERYWSNFITRRDTTSAGGDYTPYELRVVGTFVRLGWRERANQALDFFFRDQRPQAWNQWAEVVGRDLRQPRFVGDMPHGWVASDYLRSALDMFAYERGDDSALVLAAGIPEAWFTGHGVGVDGLQTPFGRLDYAIRRDGQGYVVRIGDHARPPGGFVIAAPFAGPAHVCVDGAPVAGGEVRIARARAHVRIAPC